MPDLTDNAAHHRYDMTVDGHTAYVTYALSNSRIKFIHTEVPKELGGRGSAPCWREAFWTTFARVA